MRGIIAGIDPGVSGAIAAILPDGALSRVHDVPVAIVGSARKRRSIIDAELARIIREIDPVEVWIEQVAARPGQGVASMFGFGAAYGVARGVCAALGLRVQFVTPQKWKRHHGLLGADKDASRALASQLFPQAPLARKKDVGRADALLIAEYGRRQALRGAA